MNLNDILRRLRYTFSFNDKQMIEVFANADTQISRTQVCAWLKKEEDEGFEVIPDRQMALFLNGFINLRRGRREGDQPVPEEKLNNNMVLMKLRIALNLQSEDMRAILQDTGIEFSNHEISALFRRPSHKHYRSCEDQLMRHFLKGLQMREHKDQIAHNEEPETPTNKDIWGAK
ncbi:MAG: DUF1456 family protein [Pseudohongiellaceae bacterium]|nr:DUF1456 family protein [Pseudohongiellaceae bacterium]